MYMKSVSNKRTRIQSKSMTSFKLDNQFSKPQHYNNNSLCKARELFQQNLNKTDINLGQLETTTNKFG